MVHIHHGRKPDSLHKPAPLLFRKIRYGNMGIKADGCPVTAKYQQETGLRHQIILLRGRSALCHRLYLILIYGCLLVYIIGCLCFDQCIWDSLLFLYAVARNPINCKQTYDGYDCKKKDAVQNSFHASTSGPGLFQPVFSSYTGSFSNIKMITLVSAIFSILYYEDCGSTLCAAIRHQRRGNHYKT